jgi:methylglutaconyl-CoA hydratase
MVQEGSLQTSIIDKIATIEFSHPLGNCFPAALLQQLTSFLQDLNRNDSVYAILLKSSGDGAFCAGASFDELLEVSNVDEGTRFFSGFANVINAMRKSNKIIVGRVHGKTVGGGIGLVAACDYALATVNSSIKLSELTLGIGPFVIAPAVERKMGLAAYSELALCATEWKSAYWAKEKGLFADVYKNIDGLDAALEGFCEKLSSFNPEALLEMKKALWHDTGHWGSLLYERAAISGSLILSNFSREALAKLKK